MKLELEEIDLEEFDLEEIEDDSKPKKKSRISIGMVISIILLIFAVLTIGYCVYKIVDAYNNYQPEPEEVVNELKEVQIANETDFEVTYEIEDETLYIYIEGYGDGIIDVYVYQEDERVFSIGFIALNDKYVNKVYVLNYSSDYNYVIKVL